MKEKLFNALGVVGTVLYYIISVLIAVLPICMISKSFWTSLLFFWIIQIFPVSSVIFWVWGLVVTFQGPQDFIAIIYYVLFVLLFIPFIIGIILDLFGRTSKPKRSFNYKPSNKNNADVKRKANLFRETIRNEIIAAQSSNLPSCEDLIMQKVDSIIESKYDEFKEWENDIDYNRVAIANLYNLTFDMATSGQYHLYRGVLQPIGIQLSNICRACLKKACKNGYITEEEMWGQMQALTEGIQEYG